MLNLLLCIVLLIYHLFIFQLALSETDDVVIQKPKIKEIDRTIGIVEGILTGRHTQSNTQSCQTIDMLMDEINTDKQDSDAQATLTSSISVKRSRTNENQNNTSMCDYSPTTAVTSLDTNDTITYRRLIDTIKICKDFMKKKA